MLPDYASFLDSQVVASVGKVVGPCWFWCAACADLCSATGQLLLVLPLWLAHAGPGVQHVVASVGPHGSSFWCCHRGWPMLVLMCGEWWPLLGRGAAPYGAAIVAGLCWSWCARALCIAPRELQDSARSGCLSRSSHLAGFVRLDGPGPKLACSQVRPWKERTTRSVSKHKRSASKKSIRKERHALNYSQLFPFLLLKKYPWENYFSVTKYFLYVSTFFRIQSIIFAVHEHFIHTNFWSVKRFKFKNIHRVKRFRSKFIHHQIKRSNSKWFTG
jgi:hypothetical protein